ncbi:hypothetical protein [Neobacillus drentensis]
MYWHKWDVIVTITGMTAATGTYLAGMVTIGRVLFAWVVMEVYQSH